MKRLALAAFVLSFAACSPAEDTAVVDSAAVPPAAAPAPALDSAPVTDSTVMMDSTITDTTAAAAAPAQH